MVVVWCFDFVVVGFVGVVSDEIDIEFVFWCFYSGINFVWWDMIVFGV